MKKNEWTFVGVAICCPLVLVSGALLAQDAEPPKPKFRIGSEEQRYLSADQGQIYYSIDGSDPRAEDGKPSPSAKLAKPAKIHRHELLGQGASYRYFIPANGVTDSKWASLDFDDSSWKKGKGTLGYDKRDDYLSVIKVDVKEAMADKSVSVLMRWKFEVDRTFPEDTELVFSAQCDDGLIAYLNGTVLEKINVSGEGASAVVQGHRSDSVAFAERRVANASARLRKGSNVLAIHGMNDATSSSDLLFGARLKTHRFEKGTEVWSRHSPSPFMARVLYNGKWSKPTTVSTGADDVDPLPTKEWAQFLGPARSPIYGGEILVDWPDDGPSIVWKRPIGQGYASPVVCDGKVVVAHRIENAFTIECFDALTGGPIWKKAYETNFKDPGGSDHGARSTPTIRDGSVYFGNAEGLIGALKFSDGTELWTHRLEEEFGGKRTFHGFIASPLITDDAFVIPVGSKEMGVGAFDRRTGKLLWGSQSPNEVSGASPFFYTNPEGIRQIVNVGRTELRGLDPKTGEKIWAYPSPPNGGGTTFAANPVIYGDEMFLSGSYGIGASRIFMGSDEPQLIWRRSSVMSTHYSIAIIDRDVIYGYHGHGDGRGPVMRCVDLVSGKVRWEQSERGSATMVQCGDHLLNLHESGQLILLKTNPDKYEEVARAQVTRRGTRTYPAIVDGFVYIKGPKNLVCLDLRAK